MDAPLTHLGEPGWQAVCLSHQNTLSLISGEANPNSSGYMDLFLLLLTLAPGPALLGDLLAALQSHPLERNYGRSPLLC